MQSSIPRIGNQSLDWPGFNFQILQKHFGVPFEEPSSFTAQVLTLISHHQKCGKPAKTPKTAAETSRSRQAADSKPKIVKTFLVITAILRFFRVTGLASG